MNHVVSTSEGRRYAALSPQRGVEIDNGVYDYFLNEVYLKPFHAWANTVRGPTKSVLGAVDRAMDGALLAEWRKTQPRWHAYKGEFYRYNVVGYDEIALVRLSHEEVATYLNHASEVARMSLLKRVWRAIKGD
jgi:hypothetical protein